MTLDTVIGLIFGTGGTGLIATLLNYASGKRKSKLESEDTVMARLEKENERLYKRADRLEMERDRLQDMAHRYRGLLSANGVKLDDE